MADFAPPSGPPPPRVPEGWKAVWNDQYKEWFYVNTYTKASTWDRPTEAAHPPGDAAPPGAPPGYGHATTATGPEKGAFSNNPYNQQASPNNLTEDERLARQLQEEENTRGASDSFYGQQHTSSYAQQSSPYGQQSPYGQASPSSQQQLPARDEKSRGLFGKLAGKFGGGSASRPTQGYGQQGYPQQQYGGYPQQQQQQYGGGYGGYPQQQPAYYQQQQQQKKTGGLGVGGGALLGAGAGLVGGALLMDAVEDHDQNEYNQG
ncbi:hypothetical protein LTR36_000381 [Oleoguttula mirabilis]|uniref:WW domain-containing protein n=1 Tax=Oleoguttula mirabilis TaxID=1507867 RepID=A0AAV9JYD4_9PEZI|nr:hypothetical protein LTR36_000381 [Oleoguttula mirabilis]